MSDLSTRYASRKAAGLCVSCGHIPETGRVRCRQCLNQASARAQKSYRNGRNKTEAARRQAKKAAGSCYECREPVTDGQTRCPACRSKRREYHRDRGQQLARESRKRYKERHGKYSVAVSRRRLREETLTRYGGCCVTCGESTLAFLNIDHINNDGASHRRQVHPSHLTTWLRKQGFPPGFQVLCFNCNFLKHLATIPPAATRKAANLRRNRELLKNDVLAAYGEVCRCCGVTDKRVLTIDHPNNDGASERRDLGKGGTPFYRRLRNSGFPAGYQVLCFNCNCGRAANGGACPHKSFAWASSSVSPPATRSSSRPTP